MTNWISAEEAALLLGYHPETIRRYCREGKLPCKKIGNKYALLSQDIREFSKTYDGRPGRPRNQAHATRNPKSVPSLRPSHLKILAFVVQYKQDYDGNSPTMREIGDGCGISSTSVVIYGLQVLERHGRLRLRGGKRGIIIPGGRWYPPEWFIKNEQPSQQ